MHAPAMSLQPPRLMHFLTHWMVSFAVAVMLALVALTAHAAPPPAGTSISNQASASYTDGSGVTRSVTSNVVQTTVAQIASLTLTANGAQNATAGSIVYYPHTLTNTGNGTDTFNLTAVSATTPFAMTNVQIYADNGSGQPTGSPITSTGAIAAGANFKFIVAGTLPATATAAQTNVITVTGTSVFDNTKTQSNTDTTTVTTNAVVTVTKAASVSSGPVGTSITYTLTYTNTGNSTATAVVLTDALATGLTYTANSSRWSTTGSTALSDSGSTGTAPNTLASNYNGTTRTLTYTLGQVTANQSGTISFTVTVAAGTAPGVVNNTATTSYNNGTATVTGSSNTVPFTVQQTASVTMPSPTAVPGPAAPGSTVSFTNVVTNTGNGTDTFNLTIGTTTFPSGTTFQLFKSDGATPLVDTNSDGIVDTGPLAPGATYNVILKATLPTNAATGGPYTVNKTATSVFDSSKSATATDQLTAVAGASTDLTNNAPIGGTGVSGVGTGPEGSAVLTKATNPGTTVTFTLVSNNTGPSPDTYNLGASTVANFSSTTLPASWTVTFKADGGAGNCSTTGATITNTGSVPAAGSVVVCAVVTVPAGFAAGTNDLYFRTLSPTSGATDTVHDAVAVNAVRSITFTPNGAGQTYPGGSYVYSHTLTNTGNVNEGNGTLSSIALSGVNNQSGWTSVLYYDANNDGTLDASDPAISGNLNTVAGLSAGLAPGASIRVFNKVISPSGAVIGAVDTTTITVTTTNGSYTTTAPAAAVATDNTTVIAGNLTLVKNQGLDSTCSGTAASYGTATLSAKPGECVMYRITVTNVGSAAATSVVVTDSTPSYTTLSTAAASVPAGATFTQPAVGSAGTVSATIGTLAAGANSVVTFGVKITP